MPMGKKSGISFADILIILAIILLLVALAVPFFRERQGLSEEELNDMPEDTNLVVTATSSTNTPPVNP